VDEHGIAVDSREARSNRIRSFIAALDELTDVEPSQGERRLVLLTTPNHDADGSNRRVTDQRLHCPTKYRPAAEDAKLLRDSSAHAGSASSGDDERGRCHGGRL
jgi:hypothetical protein